MRAGGRGRWWRDKAVQAADGDLRRAVRLSIWRPRAALRSLRCRRGVAPTRRRRGNSQNEERIMADDIETIRRVGLQRTYALICDLQAHRAFARLTLEERSLWEERAAARAQAFCDGLAADLALIPAPQDADPG